MQGQNCKARVYPENICTGACLQWPKSCTRDRLIYMCTRTLKVKGKKLWGDANLPLNSCLKIKMLNFASVFLAFCWTVSIEGIFIKLMKNPFPSCKLMNEPMLKNTPKCVCLNLQQNWWLNIVNIWSFIYNISPSLQMLILFLHVKQLKVRSDELRTWQNQGRC